MLEFIKNLIIDIGQSYNSFKGLYNTIGIVIGYMLFYKKIYYIIGLFFTRKFKHTKNTHKYAIMISARNEKNVIGSLLDSINAQDYDMSKVTVFVVADNCTDNTAEISRNKGAIVYERFDEEHKTKGYALQYLVKQIDKYYGVMNYEAYFIFDADNLLNKDYISRMNDAFDSGEKIVTSYRNTKNFNDGAIAASYGIHWLRSIRANHRARSVLRLATNIQGTGFLFTNEIIENGWKYTSLTEDRALTADAVAQGYRISYNNEAMFYDEQPTSLKIALRQRLRWSRGHLEAFVESGPYLFLNIFFGKLFLRTKWNKKNNNKSRNFKSFLKGILESIRHRFASYDTLMQLTPFSIINLFKWMVIPLIIYSCSCYANGINNLSIFSGGTYLAKCLRILFNSTVNYGPGFQAMLIGFLLTIWFKLLYRIGSYFESIWIAIYVFIIENKRIVKIPLYKKVWYSFCWPTFDIIGRYTTYVALFKKVTWKPIPHNSKITIDDIKK